MIPILYAAAETDFASFGLGTLPDAISCIVAEERNGEFELSMTYPAGGARANDLTVDNSSWLPAMTQPRRWTNGNPSEFIQSPLISMEH